MSLPFKYFKPLLAVSLLINVFLVCGLAGGLYQWSSHPKPVPAINQHGLRQVMVQLPGPQRHQLRQLLRQTRVENQELIVTSRQARLEVVKQLQAQTLDRSALDANLGKAREADIALRTHVDTTLADFASTLPAAERQRLAESMYFRGQAKAQPEDEE
ncbi:MAG: periplasmic heavy metal sensor [Pseudomonas sp.]